MCLSSMSKSIIHASIVIQFILILKTLEKTNKEISKMIPKPIIKMIASYLNQEEELILSGRFFPLQFSNIKQITSNTKKKVMIEQLEYGVQKNRRTCSLFQDTIMKWSVSKVF